MLAIIASDTHGCSHRLVKLEQSYPEADLLIHAGDFNADPRLSREWISVLGNNDGKWAGYVPQERVIEKDGVRIFLTHGHLYKLPNRQEEIAQKARSLNCSVAVYGHTHTPSIEKKDEVLLINPGSLFRNRTGQPISYARLELEDGNCSAEILPYFDLDQIRHS